MECYFEEQLREETIEEVAKKMAIAARTAPKARGIDNIVIVIVKKDDIGTISNKMKEMVERDSVPSFFARDAENILKSQVMLLLGTRIKSTGLNPCGMCGFQNCEEKDKYPNSPCVFNAGDLGIAIGSAVSIAMDNRIDNRIMYSVGQAVLRMRIFDEDVKIVYGIPLSVSAKNPFFDRK